MLPTLLWNSMSKNVLLVRHKSIPISSGAAAVAAAAANFSYYNLNSYRHKSSTSSTTPSKFPFPQLSDISDARIAQPDKGKIYDKKPFKVKLLKGKCYSWCCCGYSKTQPFCDLTHTNMQLKLKLKPVRFRAPETQEVWLCNCKQTAHRPFCDGTHRNEDVQSAIKS